MKPQAPKKKKYNSTPFDTNPNDNQKIAARSGLGPPEVARIHGPLGAYSSYFTQVRCTETVETHTLIEIIQQLTREMANHPDPSRVFVCDDSNLVVENSLKWLIALLVAYKIQNLKVRIGHSARVMAYEGIRGSTLDVKATFTTFTDQVNLVHLQRQLAHILQAACV